MYRKLDLYKINLSSGWKDILVNAIEFNTRLYEHFSVESSDESKCIEDTKTRNAKISEAISKYTDENEVFSTFPRIYVDMTWVLLENFYWLSKRIDMNLEQTSEKAK